MRILLAILTALVFAPAAFAQSERLIETCKSSKTEFEKRLRACDKVIELQQSAPQPWPFQERGEALADEGQHEPALAEFQRALDLDPDHEPSLSGMAFSLYRLDRFEGAKVHIDRYLKLRPEEYWPHYILGQILRGLERPDDALVAFTKSIEINPDYFWSRYRRGFVHVGSESWEKAAHDFGAAARIDPLHARAHLALADAHYKLGAGGPAARHYQIAQSLDPNFNRPAHRIEELVTFDPEPKLPPLEYTPLRDGAEVEYLMTLLPVDPRSEMERSIMAIANWFSAEVKARPEAKAVLNWKATTTGPDEVEVVTRVLDGWKVPKGGSATTQSFRGLFDLLIQPGGPQGPQIKTSYDDPDPTKAWPLEVGKSFTGTGSFAILCPEVFNLAAAFMGCRPEVVEVPVGRLEYNLYVDRVEEVLVPLGKFRTYVLRYRELSFLELGGVKRERVIETTWWIDPQTGLWVKRTGEQGGKIVTLQALAIADP